MTTPLDRKVTAAWRATLARLAERHAALAAAFIGVLLPLCAFGMLAMGVMRHEAFVFDEPLLQALHRKASPALDHAMIFLTEIGRGRALLAFEALTLAVLVYRRRVRDAVFFVLAVGGASLLDLTAKHVFQRVRPDLWVSIAPESTFSFPSAHAMQTMALYAALLALAWRTWARWPLAIAGGCCVALVGLSRMYLGVHYPSDIAAGWAASAAWVVAVWLALYRRRPRRDPVDRPE